MHLNDFVSIETLPNRPILRKEAEQNYLDCRFEERLREDLSCVQTIHVTGLE